MANQETNAEADASGRDILTAAATAATGSNAQDLSFQLADQAANSTGMRSSMSAEQRMRAAVEAIAALAPRDDLEGMLAVQMFATHNAAIECVRLAMLEGQTVAERDLNLKHAAKLLGLYPRQVEALDKHRGKGQQKIVVEHVTVNAGGQAIVGNVEPTAGAAATDAAPGGDRLALTNSPAPPAPALDLEKLVAPKRATPRPLGLPFRE
jgi:hypothetical protein